MGSPSGSGLDSRLGVGEGLVVRCKANPPGSPPVSPSYSLPEELIRLIGREVVLRPALWALEGAVFHHARLLELAGWMPGAAAHTHVRPRACLDADSGPEVAGPSVNAQPRARPAV